ncbi:MAG: hypothetical protein WD750_02795 [Gammaproteobacteria bacterium]
MAEYLNATDPVLGLPALLLLLLGLLCLLMAAVHIRKRRLLPFLTQGTAAALLLGGAVILLLLELNLHTYQRLTYEQPIAELAFSQVGPQRYELRINAAGGGSGNYRLNGDEWQLDARIMKWKAPATLAGLDARYRLERLSGRYRDINEQRERPQSVYGLTPEEVGLDLWALLGTLARYIDWVDAYYGSAAYLPMADGARYEVVLTQSGLIARPLNDEARRAVRDW